MQHLLSFRNLKLTVFAAGMVWKCLDSLGQDLSCLRVTLGSNTVSEPLICLKRNELCFLLQNSQGSTLNKHAAVFRVHGRVFWFGFSQDRVSL